MTHKKFAHAQLYAEWVCQQYAESQPEDQASAIEQLLVNLSAAEHNATATEVFAWFVRQRDFPLAEVPIANGYPLPIEIVDQAFDNCDYAALGVFLRLGVNLNSVCCAATVESPMPYLAVAASKGNATLVAYLLRTGVDVNREYDDESALTLACKRGHAGVVKMLLQYGADSDARPWGKSALELAVDGGFHDVVQFVQSQQAAFKPSTPHE